MAQLWISEYDRQAMVRMGADWLAAPMQVPDEPCLRDQVVTFTAGEAKSSPFLGQTRLVYIYTDTFCSIAVGPNPTATVINKPMRAGSSALFGVLPGHRISVVKNYASDDTSGGGSSPAPDLLAFNRYRDRLDIWTASGVTDKPIVFEDFMASTFYVENKIVTGDLIATLAVLSGAFTRASGGTAHDKTGKLIEFAANEPRYTDTGFRLEGPVADLIRNPRCEGAVVGSPGAPPTYHVLSIPAGSGLSASFSGSGVDNGSPYIDIHVEGVAAANSDGRYYLEKQPGAVTGSGVVLTNSMAAKVVAGSLSGFNTVRLRNVNYAGGSVIGSNDGPDIKSLLSGILTRFSYSAATTAGSETTAPCVELKWNAGATINLTLRIAAPQLTATPFATSIILPPAGSPAQATRLADNLVLSRASPAAVSKLIRARTAPGIGSGAQVVWFLDDNQPSNVSNRLWVSREADRTVHVKASIGGTSVVDLNLGVVADSTDFAVAFRATANDFAASINGGAVVTNTSAAMPTNITYERFGQSNGGSHWFGIVRELDELKNLTVNGDLQKLSAQM